MNLKNKILLLSVQTYQKKVRSSLYGNVTWQWPTMEWISLWKCHVTKTKKRACISNKMQLQNHFLSFHHKIKSLPSATSIPSCSPMAYNTTASSDKLTRTDYVDVGKYKDRFGRFFWSKKDSNYLDIKLKVFKRKDKNAEFWLRQNFAMGEVDFNQFIRQRNQLVVPAEHLSQRRKVVAGSSTYTI